MIRTLIAVIGLILVSFYLYSSIYMNKNSTLFEQAISLTLIIVCIIALGSFGIAMIL